MEKRTDEKKKMKKGIRGITLIALVVTIVILLILAGVALNLVIGNNGIIKRSVGAVEQTEMAQIKEEAEMVREAKQIDIFGNSENKNEKLEREGLASLINRHFEGSTMSGNRITTSNRKYDIIVRNNLDIVVVKHGQNYLKDGEIEITYYIPEEEVEESETIELYFDIAGIKPYEQFANEYLADKTTDELEELVLKSDFYIGTFEQWLTDNSMTREQFEQNAQDQGMTYDEYLRYGLSYGMGNHSWVYVEYAVSLAGGEGKNQTELENMIIELTQYPGTFDDFIVNELETTREDFPTWTQGQGFRSEKDFVKILLLEVYDSISQPISVSVSNGEEFSVGILDLYYEFNVTSNRTYTFTATGPNGETGEVTIEIDNIVGKKPTINSVLAERTSTGLKITVDATDAANYQFKIDDGEYSTSQTSNVYNYNINYSEAKTTSSTTDPYIPRGFVHTEGTVDTGYVISDLPKDYTLTIKAINSTGRGETTITKTITGSEFVWVPVDNDSSTVYTSLARGVTGKSLSSNYTEDLGASTDTTSVQYFIDSVNTNGGFYIGRYEAGMPGNISGEIPVLSANKSSRNITAIPVTRENVMPWDDIDWNNAKASSESMYNLSTEGIQSQLINSYAWDTVLNWVIASGEKTQAQVITDSTSWGNYSGSSYTFSGLYSSNFGATVKNGSNVSKTASSNLLLATGTLKERNSVKNICDIAGNLYEMTTEKFESFRVYRGWNFCDTSSIGQSASDRCGAVSVTHIAGSKGFRVVLCK